MTRLRFLRLLGMAPMARYGSMGQMHRRPDQQTDAPPSAVAPTQAAGILRARAVVIFGTGPSAGLFVYNGTPALGNPPQVAIVPTGVTKDPFGNAITSSKILIQGNIITESGGIFRTAATAPLIQLDGPHNAEWIYDAAGNMSAALATVAGNDGLGNSYPAGITEFVTISGTRWGITLAQSVAAFGGTRAGIAIQDISSSFNVPPSLTGAINGGGSELELSSGKILAGSTQAAVQVSDSVTAGLAGGQVIVNAGNFTAQTPVTGLGLVVGVQVLNDANGVAQCRLQYGVLNEQSTIPPVSTLGPIVFGSASTGMARFLADSTKGDSEAYDTGTNHRDNASPVTLSNTVFTSVFADMPIAAIKYRVNADLVVQMGGVSTTLLLKLVGPAVAAVTSVKWRATAETGTVISAGHSSGSLASVTTVAWAINAVVHVWMSADVSFTAASGTNLNLQAQLGAASATTQVLAGSTMDVSPVG